MCPDEDKRVKDQPAEAVPVSPAGAPVVACKLDEACVQVDCEQLVEDLAEVMDASPDAPEYLMHYCGVDSLKQEEEQKDKTKK